MKMLQYILVLYLIVFSSPVWAQRLAIRSVSPKVVQIDIGINLNAKAKVAPVVPNVPLALQPSRSTAVTFNDLLQSCNFMTAVSVLTGQRNSKIVTLCYTKIDDLDWQMTAYAKSEDVSHSVKGYPRLLTLSKTTASTGAYFRFLPDGRLDRHPRDIVQSIVIVPWGDSTDVQILAIQHTSPTAFAGSYTLSKIAVEYPMFRPQSRTHFRSRRP